MSLVHFCHIFSLSFSPFFIYSNSTLLVGLLNNTSRQLFSTVWTSKEEIINTTIGGNLAVLRSLSSLNNNNTELLASQSQLLLNQTTSTNGRLDLLLQEVAGENRTFSFEEKTILARGFNNSMQAMTLNIELAFESSSNETKACGNRTRHVINVSTILNFTRTTTPGFFFFNAYIFFISDANETNGDLDQNWIWQLGKQNLQFNRFFKVATETAISYPCSLHVLSGWYDD